MTNVLEILRCQCFTHGFSVSTNDEVPVVYMTAWSYGTAGNRLDWRDRLRWCWQILWHGQPHKDELVLEPEAAEKLARALMGAAAEAANHQ